MWVWCASKWLSFWTLVIDCGGAGLLSRNSMGGTPGAPPPQADTDAMITTRAAERTNFMRVLGRSPCFGSRWRELGCAASADAVAPIFFLDAPPPGDTCSDGWVRLEAQEGPMT